MFGYGVKGAPKTVLGTRANLSGKILLTIFVLLVYYSYRLAPDWMFMYFVKASEVPSWMIVYLFVLYYLAYDVGFLLKFEFQKIHRSLPIVFLALSLAASVLVTVPLKERYWNVGTYDEYHSGRTVPLSESPVGKVPGRITLLLLPLGIALLLWSRKQKF